MKNGREYNPVFMYYVYILKSLRDRRTYVGYTNDFQRRLGKHNNGQVRSTRNRRPLALMYLEKHSNKKEAKQRERWWKSGAGRLRLREFYRK